MKSLKQLILENKISQDKLNAIIVPSNAIKNNLLLINVNSSIINIIEDTRFEQILYHSIHYPICN